MGPVVKKETDKPKDGDPVGGQSAKQNRRRGHLRAEECATLALAQIARLGLKPVPHLYELWFRYYQGDPEVVRAIDRFSGQIDEMACHALYKKHLSESARDDSVRRLSDQIQEAVTGMVSMLTSAKSATSDYGRNMAGMTDRVRAADSLDDLGRIVSDIVGDTRRMLEKNQELELRLDSSSRQVSELRQTLDTVKKEAVTDSLTGLSNRKAFDKQIHDAVERARADGSALSLLMLDIDHFKTFNDTFGHQTGDQVLKLVARTLTSGVKGRDTAARFGGEEFAVILPDTPMDAAMKVADTLRRAVQGKEVVHLSTQKNLGQITLSVGVAGYTRGESINGFIGRADAALYEAKRTGRNRVVAAPPPGAMFKGPIDAG